MGASDASGAVARLASMVAGDCAGLVAVNKRTRLGDDGCVSGRFGSWPAAGERTYLPQTGGDGWIRA